MMRSMYSGVSSLRAHQLKMDVIGNNIANVNTVGFKASSVTFSETFSQTLSGASSSAESRGGTNPMQVGLGANVASIAVNHAKGSTQRTDIATDLMIDGNGFFIVTNDANAQNKFYTRAGNFALDEKGYLVTTDGMRVLDSEFKPIQINMSESKSATATERINLNGNINFNAETDTRYRTTVDLYDSLGAVHVVGFEFVGVPLTTTTPKAKDANDPIDKAGPVNYSYREMVVTDVNMRTAVNPTGQVFPQIVDGTGALITPAPGKVYAKFNEEGEVVDLVSLAGEDPDAAETQINATLIKEVPGASNISIPIDRSIFYANGNVNSGIRTLTQYQKESDAKGVQHRGISAGSIDTFNISSKGEIIGIFTNGEQKILQTIGLVDFDNPAGLLKMGSNLFKDSPNSGTPKYGTPGSGSFGGITAGALEMSNVDLAAQFTEMITTQRGFQANSRVISTSDEILQELVNLKR